MNPSTYTESSWKRRFLILDRAPSGVAVIVETLHSLVNIAFDDCLVTTPQAFETALDQQQWDLILCNFDVPQINMTDVVRLARRLQPQTPLIVVSDSAAVHDAVDMMRLGASGFVETADQGRLVELIRQELEAHPPVQHFSGLEEETRYRGIVENQTELICRFDADFRLTFANRAYSEWLGIPPQDLIGADIIGRIPESERVQAIAKVKNLTADHPVVMSVHSSIMPDGSLRLIEWTDRALFDTGGNLIEYQGVGRDVTQRERQTQQLQAMKSALELHHSQLNTILDTIQDAVISVSLPDQQLIFASASFERIFGYPVQTFVNNPDFFKQIAHPDDLAQAIDAMQTCLRDGFAELDHRVILPNGQVRWLHRRAWMNFDEDGRPIRVTDTAVDITSRKTAEAAQRASEEKYRSLVESSDAAISLVDTEGRYLFLNRISALPFGVPPNTLVGRTVYELFPAPQADAILADVDKVIAENAGVVLETEVTLTGTPRWYRTSIQPVRDGSGHPYAALIHASDVTEQRRAQQAIREQNEILQQSRDLIGMVNAQGVVTFMNMGGARLMGADTPEQLIGKTIPNFHTPEDTQRTLNEYLPAARAGQWRGETRLRTLDGRTVDVDQTIFPIVDQSGAITHFATIMADITARKQTEDALRASEEKYRSLIESSDAVIAMFNTEGQILYGNAIAAQQLQVAPEMLIGKTIHDLFPLEIANHQLAAIQQVIKTGIGNVAETVSVVAGEPRWYRTSIQPIHNASGRVTAALINATDITRFKEAEAALQEAHALLEKRVIERTAELERTKDRIEAIFNHSGDGIVLLNVKRGIQQANQAFAEMFDIPVSGSFGRKLRSFFPSDEMSSIQTSIQAVAQEHQTHHIEVGAKRSDGTRFDVEISIAPVNRSDKVVDNLVCIIRDITARRRTETALRDSENMLHRVIENIPVRVFWKDRQSVYLGCNRLHAAALGFADPSTIIGKTDREFFPELAIEWEIGDRTVINTGIPLLNQEESFIEADGATHWQIYNKVPLRDSSGATVGVLATIEDITARKRAEIAVAEERNLLRTLIDAMPDFIYIKDRQHRMLFNNIAHSRSLGGTKSITGKTDFDLFPIEMAANFHADEEKLFETGQAIVNKEERTFGEDGSEIWALTTKMPLRNLHGELIGLVGITRDVSKIKDNEEALRRSEKQLQESQIMLQLVLDTIPVRVFWKDVDSVYMGCNRMFLLDVGMSQISDIVGKRDADLPWSPDEIAAYREADASVIESGAPKLEYLEPLRTANGERKVIQISKFPLRDTAENIIGVLGTYIDITERKRAEDALRESETRYRLLAENVRDVIMKQSLERVITFLSPSVFPLLGYKPEEMVGHLGTEFVHPDDKPQANNTVVDTLNSGRAFFTITERIRHKDGHYIWVEMTNTVVRDPITNAPIEFVGLAHDITENKQAEDALKQALVQEKELGELKSRFISMASHEFRTPLASILATTETLTFYRDRMDKAQIDERLDRIRQQVVHMKEMMEGVLQLARIQARRVEFRPSVGNLHALCQEIIEEFDNQTEYHGRIVYECPTVPVTAEFDGQLMRQVISNLVHNALKYSAPDKPVLMNLIQDDIQWTLTVKDEGIGIPPEDMKRLYEPFHRAKNVGTISGTGLGLSITKQAVELHGGTIVANSQVGIGTTFTVVIPKAPSKEGSDDESARD